MLEEHYVIGGLGTIVQEVVGEECPVRVKKPVPPSVFSIYSLGHVCTMFIDVG
jgi:transketolase C-terminal domain/subunit